MEHFAALDHSISVGVECLEAVISLLIAEFGSVLRFEVAMFVIAVPDELKGLVLGHASIAASIVLAEDWVDALVDKAVHFEVDFSFVDVVAHL